MRRKLTVLACLAVLVFASAPALARGPHHGGGHYRGPAPRHGYHGGGWNGGWNDRGFCGTPPRPYCPPKPCVTAYPAYAPAYPAYPQFGFGIAGRNFSFWAQQ